MEGFFFIFSFFCFSVYCRTCFFSGLGRLWAGWDDLRRRGNWAGLDCMKYFILAGWVGLGRFGCGFGYVLGID